MVSKVVTKKIFIEDVTMAQAMDDLTSMAGLNRNAFKKGKKPSKEILRWWDSVDDHLTLNNIKVTFRVILNYLKDTYKKDKEKIQDEEIQKGLRAVMTLIAEAAQNIDRYTHLVDKGIVDKSITELKEYQELQEFYQKKMIKKFDKKPEPKELWKEEWGEAQDELLDANAEQRGLKDLESVKQDHQYELLYIKKEDGSRFFNQNLLRHIKLVNDFDQMVVSEENEDPFLLLQKVQDKEALESSRGMKEEVFKHLATFLKSQPHKRSSELSEELLYSVYALFLATSQHNLLEAGGRKSCFQYFNDYVLHLNGAFLSTDYHAHLDASLEEGDLFMQGLVLFAYQLCNQLFMRIEAKDQLAGLITMLMDKIGAGEKDKQRPSTQMWTALAAEYEHLDHVLKKYPNGPLFKTLDIFSSSKQWDFFEPLTQQNHPSLVYHIHNESIKVSVLRIPSPTKQEMINKAEISGLFENFIRSLKLLHRNQKLLFINLQDRTSWQEYARCQVIEQMPKLASFVDVLDVCTLAKDTSFYSQIEEYADVSSAEEFKELLCQQISNAQECGFYFPKNLVDEHLQGFVKNCVTLIHQYFFGNKGNLSHKNRVDFIEIFYFFFTLKILDVFKPSHLAISCKDAIDTSPASYAGFFAFLKLMSQDFEWSQEEEGFFVWMMQAPALLQRERAIHAERYHRMISALAAVSAELDVDRRKILSAFEKIYGYPIFKNMTVREAKL